MEYTTTVSANEPITITIGNFDGVHRGHQRLMHDLNVMARELHSKPVLVTFSPHTLQVVRPDIDVQYLTTTEEKLALAKQYGHIPDSIVIHFTPEVAKMSAYDFMESLRTHFNIRGIVVGTDFSLGHNRLGNVTFLERYGQEHGLRVQAIPLQEEERARISSTQIRRLVSAGKISEANELLGHPVIVSGVVVEGDKRGRLLGFPTANLIPELHKLLPADGVYVVHVSIENTAGGDEIIDFPVYNGVVNIGVRPTFDGKKRLVEAHLLGLSSGRNAGDTPTEGSQREAIDLDLYSRRIRVAFIARLRGEQRFAGIEALKAQIAADVQQAHQILQTSAATSFNRKPDM